MQSGDTVDPARAADFISPEESRAAMRRVVWAQSFGAPFYWALTSGGLATLYAGRFGARDLMVGVLNGGLWAGFIVAFFMPALIDRYNKRPVLMGAMLAGLAAGLVLIAAPPVARLCSDTAALAMMAAAFLLCGCSYGAFMTAWYPALMDFVPVERAGAFFSLLRGCWQSVALAMYLLGSVVVGPDAPRERFQIILAVLSAGMVVRIFLVRTLPQRPVVAPESPAILARLRRIFGHAGFRRYIGFSAVVSIVTAAPFPSMVLFLNACGYSARAIMVALATGMLASVVSYRWWGRSSDAYGPGRPYRVSLTMLAAAFLLLAPVSLAVWAWDAPRAAYAAAVAAILLYTVGVAGVNLALTRHSFQLTPRDQASTYLSLLPIFAQAATTAGTVLVGGLMQAGRASEARHWLNPYVVLFVVLALMSLAVIPWVRRMPKTDEIG